MGKSKPTTTFPPRASASRCESRAEVSPTGSGDVLLASLLDSLFRRERPLDDAVAAALPLAAANAAHPGIAEFP